MDVLIFEEFYVVVIFPSHKCHFKNYNMDKSIEMLLDYYQMFLDMHEKQVHMMFDSWV